MSYYRHYKTGMIFVYLKWSMVLKKNKWKNTVLIQYLILEKVKLEE